MVFDLGWSLVFTRFDFVLKVFSCSTSLATVKLIIKQRPVVVYNAEKLSLQYGIRANSAIASAMNTEFSLEIAN